VNEIGMMMCLFCSWSSWISIKKKDRHM